MNTVKVGDIITRSDGKRYIILNDDFDAYGIPSDILILSEDSGLAQSLLGAQVGDKFNFNNKYKIVDIISLEEYMDIPPETDDIGDEEQEEYDSIFDESPSDLDSDDDISIYDGPEDDAPNKGVLNLDELEHEANSVHDDTAIDDNTTSSVRAEYEELKKTPEFRKWRAKQYAIQKGHCAYCYRVYSSSRMQVDHITPICHGGKNEYSNFVLACKYCNEKLKFTSAFNRISYFRAKKRIRNNHTLKSQGYVPIKIYWKRPKWIPPNPYSNDDVAYDDSIPEDERDVWDFVNPIAPISIVDSIKQEDVEDMSGFVAPLNNTSQQLENSSESNAYNVSIFDGISEFFDKYLVSIIIVVLVVLFFWFVASGGTWRFDVVNSNNDSSNNTRSGYKESLSFGCGEELLCYSDAFGENEECHCVYEYSPECEDD